MEDEETLIDWLIRDVAETSAMYDSWPEEARPLWYVRSKMCLDVIDVGLHTYECNELRGHAEEHVAKINGRARLVWSVG